MTERIQINLDDARMAVSIVKEAREGWPTDEEQEMLDRIEHAIAWGEHREEHMIREWPRLRDWLNEQA